MKLHGCWIYGYTLDLHCLDETSKHDAACIIEILAQSIQRVTFSNYMILHVDFCCVWVWTWNGNNLNPIPLQVFDICNDRQVAPPRHLIVVVPRTDQWTWMWTVSKLFQSKRECFFEMVFNVLRRFFDSTDDCHFQMEDWGGQYGSRSKKSLCAIMASSADPPRALSQQHSDDAAKSAYTWQDRLGLPTSVSCVLFLYDQKLEKFVNLALADQLWGVLSRRLGNSDRMLTDEDWIFCFWLLLAWGLPTVGLLSILCAGYDDHSQRGVQQARAEAVGWHQHWDPGQEIECSLATKCSTWWLLNVNSSLMVAICLQAYHAWRDCFDKCGVVLEGGLLEDSSANHFFMALQFRGSSNVFTTCWPVTCC